jgi:hypothetical protein
MPDPFRRHRRAVLATRPPAWSVLVPPAFRLIAVVLIACYVELLVAQGHSLAAAVVAAVGVGAGGWLNQMSLPVGFSVRASA